MLLCYCAHLSYYYEVRFTAWLIPPLVCFTATSKSSFCVTFSCSVGGVEFLERPVSQHRNKETWIWVGAALAPENRACRTVDWFYRWDRLWRPGTYGRGTIRRFRGEKNNSRRKKSENHSDLPSLWKVGLLGLVTLLKNSSNWKACGEVSLGTRDMHSVMTQLGIMWKRFSLIPISHTWQNAVCCHFPTN